MLGKKNNYSLKWWFDDDLPYVESKKSCETNLRFRNTTALKNTFWRLKSIQFFATKCNFRIANKHFPPKCSENIQLSHEKNSTTFHHTGWLIGILIMGYCNPIKLGSIISYIPSPTRFFFITQFNSLRTRFTNKVNFIIPTSTRVSNT